LRVGPHSSNVVQEIVKFVSELNYSLLYSGKSSRLLLNHEALVLCAALSPPQFLSRTPPRVHHDDDDDDHRPSSLFLRLAHSEVGSFCPYPPTPSCAVRSSPTPSLLFFVHPTRRHRRHHSRRRSRRGSHSRRLRPRLHLRLPHPAKPHSTGSNFCFFFLDKISSYIRTFRFGQGIKLSK
jgi:hypothetical protein